mmetsp:Transcript_68149/g.208921  ORF Transcript_68149/g.208921 Transcript_68149/m.208921 type:complete len:96 (+) Transcript_68149:107-394(+)
MARALLGAFLLASIAVAAQASDKCIAKGHDCYFHGDLCCPDAPDCVIQGQYKATCSDKYKTLLAPAAPAAEAVAVGALPTPRSVVEPAAVQQLRR